MMATFFCLLMYFLLECFQPSDLHIHNEISFHAVLAAQQFPAVEHCNVVADDP